ncbi:peptidylprolyl isomerase [Paracoccus seriniphilus]|uniref:peptidylprolyl isomerase n=1 Tax=Paracoccus seriniphilus TaxID=184748 RepID=UPI0035674B8B
MLKSLLIPAVVLLAGNASAQVAAPAFEDGPGPNMVIEVAAADGTAKGTITLDLLADAAPKHVERLVALAKQGAYDGVVFHRVIDGFMAQTGDVQYGKQGGNTSMAGSGGSDQPDLKAEFSDIPFQAGTVGMARAQSVDSANSQFFIDLAPAPFLNGKYTVVGQLIDGWDVLNSITKGDEQQNGAVQTPDYMAKVTITE